VSGIRVEISQTVEARPVNDGALLRAGVEPLRVIPRRGRALVHWADLRGVPL